MTQAFAAPTRSYPIAFLLGTTAAALALVWAFWTTLAEMATRWGHDPQYSHGYLVPVFAVVLLWLRRDKLASGELRPNYWLGLPLLAVGLCTWLVGGFFYFVWVDAIALLPCLAGIVLLLGGGRAFQWSWPAIAFLFFMVPLPHRLSVSMAGPLQAFATTTSTFLLQTFGFPALSEGNVILLNEVEIGIVEACSGLRMLVIFFAMSTGFVLVIRRAWWEKVLYVVSAIPIALVVNIIRITVTGILHETVGSETANAVFHDLAGWLMMPLALLFLGVELQLVKHLFREPVAGAPARRNVGLRPRMPSVARA
jgi:exosortase